jgi:Zn-dependent peptidase ImmA (M78 family)/transcriptional regulator with XRE-family HTH domain
MAIDLKMFADKVNRYCAQFQVSPQEIAEKTGIPAARLKNITEHREQPTGDEVLIIADFFKCDYKFFISNERLAPFEQTEELFRSHGDILSRDDRWAIQEFLFLCECQEFLLHEVLGEPELLSFEFQKQGTYFKAHGQNAAAELRRFLGYQPHAVPINIYRDFRRLGIHIFRRQLGQSTISGIYLKHPVAGHCVLVNYSEDVFRQRFTVAHEVAHAILDNDKDFVVSFANWEQNNLSEIRANVFASHFLMPPEFLAKIPEQTHWDSEKVLLYAQKLRVNPEPLAYALREAGLISDTEASSFKFLKIPRELKADPELPNDLTGRARMRKEALLQRGLSDDYVTLCLQAYDDGIITHGRLSEMLLIDETELDQLCSVYGRMLDHGN